MNTFAWKSIWRIRHTDEMHSILEVVLNSCLFCSIMFSIEKFYRYFDEKLQNFDFYCKTPAKCLKIASKNDLEQCFVQHQGTVPGVEDDAMDAVGGDG